MLAIVACGTTGVVAAEPPGPAPSPTIVCVGDPRAVQAGGSSPRVCSDPNQTWPTPQAWGPVDTSQFESPAGAHSANGASVPR